MMSLCTNSGSQPPYGPFPSQTSTRSRPIADLDESLERDERFVETSAQQLAFQLIFESRQVSSASCPLPLEEFRSRVLLLPGSFAQQQFRQVFAFCHFCHFCRVFCRLPRPCWCCGWPFCHCCTAHAAKGEWDTTDSIRCFLWTDVWDVCHGCHG